MITLPSDVIMEATKDWPVADKKEIDKRISGQSVVEVFQIYKLFMPQHLQKVLRLNGYSTLCDRWDAIYDAIPAHEVFDHLSYCDSEWKAMKMAHKDCA